MTNNDNGIDSQELINTRLSHKELQKVCYKLLQRVSELETWTRLNSWSNQTAREEGDSLQDTIKDWTRGLTEEVAMKSLNVKPKFKAGDIVSLLWQEEGNGGGYVVSRVTYSTRHSEYQYLLHNVESGWVLHDCSEDRLQKKNNKKKKK